MDKAYMFRDASFGDCCWSEGFDARMISRTIRKAELTTHDDGLGYGLGTGGSNFHAPATNACSERHAPNHPDNLQVEASVNPYNFPKHSALCFGGATASFAETSCFKASTSWEHGS